MSRTPELQAIAEQARAHFNGITGFANSGRLNVYTCEDARCAREVVTIDREPGVTPFMTICPDCGGLSQSGMYRALPEGTAPTHEWYRPDALEGLTIMEADHVRKCGLLLRQIAPAA